MSGLRLRVDTIVNKDDTAGTGFASTVGIPTGQSITAPNTINFTGINTVGILSATSANIAGIITATFVGDGSALGIAATSIGHCYGLQTILQDPPLRA